MTVTTSVHIATVRRFNPATGVATIVIPALYGDTPIEARPFLTTPAELANLPLLTPGSTVIAFYDGGDPMTIPRWYLAGGGATGGGAEEVFVGTTNPGVSNTYELWYDPAGVPGEPGGGGPSGPVSYIHNQGTVASTWVIDHDLGFHPNVVVEDSGGSTIEGEIVYNTVNQVTLTFSAAFSGVAYLS